MYAESHVRRKQVSGLSFIIEGAADTRPGAPELVQAQEEGGAIDRLLTAASTEDERFLVGVLDGMLDRLTNEGLKKATGKGLRGELRAVFLGGGGTKERYYKAFRGLERMATT